MENVLQEAVGKAKLMKERDAQSLNWHIIPQRKTFKRSDMLHSQSIPCE